MWTAILLALALALALAIIAEALIDAMLADY